MGFHNHSLTIPYLCDKLCFYLGGLVVDVARHSDLDLLLFFGKEVFYFSLKVV